MEDMDAYRGDVGELRHEMQLGFARVDARFERLEANIDARFGNSELRFEKFEAKMEAIMEKGLRKQTQFFFLAWSVLLAAIVGLYARVS